MEMESDLSIIMPKINKQQWIRMGNEYIINSHLVLEMSYFEFGSSEDW